MVALGSTVRSYVPKSTIRIEGILGDTALLEHLAECEICRKIPERLNRERALVESLYERRN